MRLVRMVAVGWLMQFKIHSRSSFDGLLALIWPLFYATTVLLMYRAAHEREMALLSATVGAAVMGIWSATSTRSGALFQAERRQGTLELLTVAPAPFPLVMLPVTLAMATIGAVSMAITLLWGWLVFGISLDVQRPFVFIAATAVTVISIAMLGFLLAVSSVRYRAGWALGSVLETPVWLTCGFLVPLSLLPKWVTPVSWALGPTWGMAAVRSAAVGGPALLDIAICLALALGYGMVGSLACRYLLHSARTRATLALT